MRYTDPEGRCVEDLCVVETAIVALWIYGIYTSVQDINNLNENSSTLEKSYVYIMAAASFSPNVGAGKGALRLAKNIEPVAENLFKKYSPNVLGKAGEIVAGVSGKIKEAIKINGRVRIPDEINDFSKTIKEVKNVHYQGLTSQIKDSLQYAKQEGYTFELYTRYTTKISKLLQNLINKGEIKHIKMDTDKLLNTAKTLNK